MNEEQRKALQALSPAQRIQAGMRLYASARRIKAAALRQFHPEWSDEQVKEAVRQSFLHARS
jgi:hypothetical protein